MKNKFLIEALKYADLGWAVCPLHSVIDGVCSCEDSACEVQGKHPRMERDSEDAHFRGTGSMNSRQIKEWWELWPESNVSIVCGEESGLVAIDIDPRNGGFETLEELESENGDIRNTVRNQTGGGGLHLLFQHPQNGIIRNRIGLYPGVDVKADKGRIVAPPSNHASGGSYKWENGFGPSEIKLASLPEWLFEAIQHRKGTGTWQVMKRG